MSDQNEISLTVTYTNRYTNESTTITKEFDGQDMATLITNLKDIISALGFHPDVVDNYFNDDLLT